MTTTLEAQTPLAVTTTETAPPSRPNNAPARRFNIPGDVVNQVTRDMPDEPRGLLRWLHSFGASNDHSYDDLGRMLKRGGGRTYDGNTVFKVLTGRHEANVDNFVTAVRALKKYEEERATVTRIRHVPTQTSQAIFAFCQGVLSLNKMGFIEGESQIGKTASLKEYARTHNHGETIYLRMPAGGGKRAFMEELAVAALRISPQQSSNELRRRLVRCFDRRMLLVIDEAHQMFIKTNQVDTLEFIREIHDYDNCGLILCGTEIFSQEIQTAKLKRLLGQTDRRKLGLLKLPPRPTRSDLDIIAREYKLPAIKNHRGCPVTIDRTENGKRLKETVIVFAEDLEKEIIRDHSLGVWFTILQSASKMANKRSDDLTWDHVVRAHTALKAMEVPNLD